MPELNKNKFDLSINQENPNPVNDFLVQFIGQGKKVLDLGVESEIISKILNNRKCMVTTLDISSSLKDENMLLDTVVTNSLEKISLSNDSKSDSYDIILIRNVLEFLKNPIFLLKKLNNFLKNNGCIVCSIPNIAHGSIRLLLLDGHFNFSKNAFFEQRQLHFFTLDTILSTIVESGYTITDLKRIKRGIFDMENTNLKSFSIPEELVQAILRDSESTTLQYVLRVVKSTNINVKAYKWSSGFTRNLTTNDLKNRIDDLKRKIEDLK